jgi:hypothetical protein
MSEYIEPRRIEPEGRPNERLTRLVLKIAGYVPKTGERKSGGPERRARAIMSEAANKAALAAGTLALPPGPLGWLTILPELAAVWRIQRQMVADIAGAYGVDARLDTSQMMYCLFRYTAAQAVRDVAVQVGARAFVQDAPLHVIEKAATKIGVGMSGRLAGRSIARWLPVIGALGVGAYAYYDTGRVARTAIELFSREAAPAGDAEVAGSA